MRIRNVFASFLIAFALLGKWEVQQTATTAVGAKTMDIDTENHKVYLPTSEFEEAKPGARPAAKPGTFMIVVVARH